MKSSLLTFSLLCFSNLCCLNFLAAQYPQYVNYNDENGAPSNEIYSLSQDKKGFIWLGTAAGLYKFDGLRYTTYKCSSQKSKAIAGLTLSSKGRLYGQNFQSQIFYIDGDSLHELKHAYRSVPNMACDQSGRLFVNHLNGIAAYDEGQDKWTNYENWQLKRDTSKNILANLTRSVKVNLKNEVHFMANESIGSISGDKLVVDSSGGIAAKIFDFFSVECYANELWFFPRNGEQVYSKNNDSGRFMAIENGALKAALRGRKITQVRYLQDNSFWICTYKGLVRYTPKDGTVRIFYPDIAFSDCLIDRENNYWFATLQMGLLRLPNLNFLVWAKAAGINTKVSKVQHDGQRDRQTVYFAGLDGSVGRLITASGEVRVYNSGQAADIQALDYIAADGALYFYLSGALYTLRGDKTEQVQAKLPPIKQILKVKEAYFVASSFGAYIHDLKTPIDGKQRLTSWTREMVYDSKQEKVWAATNNGLFSFAYADGQWLLKDTLFLSQQFISLCFDEASGQTYALNFLGEIYGISQKGESKLVAKLVAKLPASAQGYKLKYYGQKLYLASDKGLWVWDLSLQVWAVIDTYSGLAANNIQDITFMGGKAWLAVGQGLQQIPISLPSLPPLAKLYLKTKAIGGLKLKEGEPLDLTYQQSLILQLEASIYSSNGNFEYAYRVKSQSDEWTDNWSVVPAKIEQITILNIPDGNFALELKAIDHLGRTSENIIRLTGYVKPPFWRSNWFFGLILIIFLAVVFYIFKNRVAALRKQQAKALAHLELENALSLSQQTALKAQMNPHFIFNVLNSIKSYIYKNDKQKASAYLNDFSDLIRSVLDMSGQNYVSLAEELQMLELYIGLEAMMLQTDFSYAIDIAEDLSPQSHTLPALLLQPYIENAFKHGLQHQQGAKTLYINAFLTAEEHLCLTIRDNGIGRRAAQIINAENNSNRQIKHQSFATKATEKRIELINREGKQAISCQISDLYGGKGEPLGTEVTIIIKDNDE